MAVTSFQDLPMADRDREWDGDADNKDNFTAYKLLVADVIGDRLKAVPRGVTAAGKVMQGSRGGVDLPQRDDRAPGEYRRRYRSTAAGGYEAA